MWKVDANGDASNELGEKIWLTNERGCPIIRRTTFVATKKWRGFTRGLVASFPKNYPEEDAREFLYRHVDFLNLNAELPPLTVKELWRELDARRKARRKSKMFSLWAQ